MTNVATDPDFAAIAQRIWHQLASAEFRGSDPYDGLNSRLLSPVLKRSRLARLVVIQAVKRSPIDLRPLLMIPPGLNPKGLALMLQGAAEWTGLQKTEDQYDWLGDALISLASTTDGGPVGGNRDIQTGVATAVGAGQATIPSALGWGYDFPWQSKAFLQPAFSPTVVATSFVIDGLEMSNSPALIEIMAAAGHFVADHLQRYEDNDGICFSYSPDDQTRVYNASLFGARILAQAANYVPEQQERWRSLARQAVNWVMARQASDGSWIYGEADHWQWIDNLHTGFNLETVARVADLLDCREWDEGLAKGLAFYRENLFEPDGTPRYYTTSRYPLDPHSFAQGALTFLRLSQFDATGPAFARQILDRGVQELWDERRGGFKFQKHRTYAQRSIHMRWSQAWMFRAICALLSNGEEDA